MDGSSNEDVARPAARNKRRGIKRRSPVSRALRAFAAVIWPQRSLVTGREVVGPGPLEAEHWSRLEFLSAPLCARCGAPFEIAVDDDQVCAACIARPPAYDRARAALVYGDISRDLVLALKHQGRRDGLAQLGGWMATAGGQLLAETDLIIPVPLHYLRLVQRGFNQSVWLAAALRRTTGVPVSVDALKRVKATPKQGGLSADGRRRNVQGAFKVRARCRRLVQGKRIVLIDDVFTTGATAEACARELRRAGAVCVDVLTLTRVAGPRSTPI